MIPAGPSGPDASGPAQRNRGGPQLSPPVARVLLDVASYWGPVINGATISMLAPVVALSWRQNALLPRWLGVLGTVTLVERM